MKSMKSLFAMVVAALFLAAAPAVHAQCPNNGAPGSPCLHFVAAGSSAMWQTFASVVVNEVAPLTNGFTSGGNIHHYTLNGPCPNNPTGWCATIYDSRQNNNTPIPSEPATVWVAWVCGKVAGAVGCTGTNATDVWEYCAVNSTVGVRALLAQPSAECFITQNIAPGDLISAALFLHGANTGHAVPNCTINPPDCDEPLPADVFDLITGATINSAFTDISEYDAEYATQRALAAGVPAAPWTGLGYCCIAGGAPNIGKGVLSAFTGTDARPVAFGLPGTADPFNANLIVPPSIKTYHIGVAPTLFITNRTDATGLGQQAGGAPIYNNVIDNGPAPGVGYGVASPIGLLFGGTNCLGTNAAFVPNNGVAFPVSPILMDPISGSMNTVEFAEFRSYGGSLATTSSVNHGNVNPGTSQEAGVFPGPINPLGGAGAPTPVGTPCAPAQGNRYRAIGTLEEVGKPAAACAAGFTGVGCTPDSIGYAFFGFGNFESNQWMVNPNYGYLMLDQVDPVFNAYAGGDPGQPGQGELPFCRVAGGGCSRNIVWNGGNYFPHLVDGSYRSWSMLRVLCDGNNPTCSINVPASGAPSDSFGTLATVVIAQDNIHNSALTSIADFLPMSLDGSFPAGAESSFGDVTFARSHHAFVSIAPGLPSDYPATHNVPAFNIGPKTTPAGALPVVVENANQANGIFTVPINNLAGFFLAGPYAGPYFSLAQGGDAGGCIINATQSGDLLAVTSLQPVNNAVGAPTPNHLKVFFNETSGPNGITEPNGAASTFGPDAPNGPYGWCGGGSNNGGWCNQSNTGPANPNAVVASPQCGSVGYKGDPANPFGYTCNAAHLGAVVAGDGESIAITGVAAPAAYAVWNGVFDISKFVLPGVIKAKVTQPPAGYPVGQPKAAVNAGSQASISAGCAQ